MAVVCVIWELAEDLVVRSASIRTDFFQPANVWIDGRRCATTAVSKLYIGAQSVSAMDRYRALTLSVFKMEGRALIALRQRLSFLFATSKRIHFGICS